MFINHQPAKSPSLIRRSKSLSAASTGSVGATSTAGSSIIISRGGGGPFKIFDATVTADDAKS